MKKVLGVFAHPDDEAFGPGGTLAMLAKEQDVYLICVTNGEAGQNNSKKTDEVSSIRKAELLESAKILGVKNVFFLGYKDGGLSNNIYQEIAIKLQEILETLKPETLLTIEQRGVTGHIDHIAVSMITTYVFKKLKFINELWYYCLTERLRELHEEYFSEYFVYFPPGYKQSEISKAINTESVWEQKVKAMKAHESQEQDVKKLLSLYETLPKEEHFIILKK